jgi:glycosyltransferase involved in cell wall biosynthesis
MPSPPSAPRRFGSADPFFDESSWRYRMGRPLANAQFLAALLQYSRFDAFDFFLPDVAYVERWMGRLAELLPDPADRRRIHAWPMTQLTAQLDAHPFAVFHQGDFTYFMPQLVALRQARGTTPFCVTGVTHSLDNLQERFISLVHADLQSYDGIVCTSRAAQAVVRHQLAQVAQHWQRPVPPVSTAIIPLGIEAAQLELPAPSEEGQRAARQHLGLPLEGVGFISLGRLSLRSKNDWAPIFALWARLETAGVLRDSFFVLAGGCAPESLQLWQDLRQRFGLQGRLFLLPNLPPKRKKALFAAADVFLALVDNAQESFGLCVLEAMAARLPCLAVDFDGYRDMLTDGQDAVLIPTVGSVNLPGCLQASGGLLDPGMVRLLGAQMTAVDLDALQKGLLRLLQQPAWRRSLGLAAKQRAQAFAWPRVIGQYEVFWEQLGGQRPTQAQPAPAARWRLGGAGLAAFSGHVSHPLQPHDRLSLTEVGAALRQQPDEVVRYADVEALLAPAVEQALLGAAYPQASLDDLRTAGLEAGAAEVGDVDFHLLWLLKQGALRLHGVAK